MDPRPQAPQRMAVVGPQQSVGQAVNEPVDIDALAAIPGAPEDRRAADIGNLFDERSNLLDQNFVRRVDTFLNELIWMARVLRHGRENIAPV